MITTVIHFRYSGLQFRKKEEKGKKKKCIPPSCQFRQKYPEPSLESFLAG